MSTTTTTTKVFIELQNPSPVLLINALKVLDNAGITYNLKEEDTTTSTLTFEETALLGKSLGKQGVYVLDLLSEGYKYREIAAKLNITLDGVRYYVKRIFKTLGVNSGTNAVRIYITEIKPYIEANAK